MSQSESWREPAEPISCGPRTVADGECIHSIAGELGVAPDVLWSDPANARLKAARRNPGALLRGDALSVPTGTTRSAETGGETVFQAGVTPRYPLVLQVLGEPPTSGAAGDHEDEADGTCCGHDDEGEVARAVASDAVHGMPLPNTPCRLVGEGVDAAGRTDADGKVSFDVPTALRRATLEVGQGDARFELELEIGYLRAVESAEGVLQRLANMGMFFGDPAAEPDDVARLAIWNARQMFGLSPGVEPDEALRSALSSLYGG